MDIAKYINRYRTLKKAHVGKTSLLKSMWLFMDYMGAYIVHGASFNDYFVYCFYKLNRKGRKEYITYRRYHKIQKIFNPDSKAIQKLRDKKEFNKFFDKYLGRKWIEVKKDSYGEFEKFINNCSESVFVKDIGSFRGIGVKQYNTGETDIRQLYQELIRDKDAEYIIEEKLIQKGELAKFHPWSINTIRVITLYDRVKDEVHIMSGNIRVGRNMDVRDNLHSGGIACQIDIESGVVISPGFNQDNELFLFHPDTQKQFVGFKVPYWEECKDFIIKVAREIPEVGYIGWDVVSKGDGTFVLIEGNDNADHDIQQLNYKPLWNEYKKILKGITSHK